MAYKASILVLLAAAAVAGGVGAQTVYRCGDSYSQQPCPGGKQVQADDPRTASQRAQTVEAARRDARTADGMEKARLKEEAKPAPAVILAPAASASAPQPGKPASAPRIEKRPAHLTAVSPAKKGEAPSGKKKKKAKKKPVE